jgi:ABC-type lipoprotein export system ATPase subunit
MSKIKIKNFGPIKEGYQEHDGWLDVKKVTIFIGNQGSGKSTVAKLISTMTWIEKAIEKRILKQDELSLYNRFLKQLAYQRIDKYINANSEIEFIGQAYIIKFKDGEFKATKSSTNGYKLPKIMYVPAERSFLSVFDRPDKVKKLPLPVYTFNEEFDTAKHLYAQGLELPINKARFEFDKFNKIAHIVGDENSYKIRLSEASSGFQSIVPLYLVSKYLMDRIENKIEDETIQEESLEVQKKIDKQVKAILDDPELTDDIKQAYLRQLSANKKPSCFINIVEEPEQNLFPGSQQKILNSLLEINNRNENNKLIMTTHSPYLINYLSISIQGDYLLSQIAKKGNSKELIQRLDAVVPIKSIISGDDAVVYQLDEKNGTILKLANTEGIPSDKNFLNQSLRHGNELFDSLLEIEEEL